MTAPDGPNKPDDPHVAATRASESHAAATGANESHAAATRASESHPAATRASESHAAATRANESHPAATRASEPRWLHVAKLAALRAGDVIAVEADGVAMVLAREGDAVYALQRRCLHRGGDLADGIISRGHVICPMHGWRFAAATGCHDQASDVCLTRYAVRVVGDAIEVDPTPLRNDEPKPLVPRASGPITEPTERIELAEPPDQTERLGLVELADLTGGDDKDDV